MQIFYLYQRIINMKALFMQTQTNIIITAQFSYNKSKIFKTKKEAEIYK
jgi:hypothetical protein